MDGYVCAYKTFRVKKNKGFIHCKRCQVAKNIVMEDRSRHHSDLTLRILQSLFTGGYTGKLYVILMTKKDHIKV